MAYFDSTRPAPFGALTVYRVVNFFDDLRMRNRERRLARVTERALRQISDRELDDLGLDRGTAENTSR